MSGIYTFFGVDHKCGTSMLCQSVAELIANEMPNWKILVIHTEGAPGTDYASGTRESMERIRPELAEGLIDVRDIMARAQWHDNLYLISGADPLEGDGKYHPNVSDHLLRNLKGFFDLILCDSGSQIDHGLALGSLFASDGILLVMIQAESAVRRFERLIPLYHKLNVATLGCLINRYQDKNPYTLSYLRERLDQFSGDFYTVGESSLGLLAEAEGKALIHYKDKAFGKDVRSTANLILEDIGVAPIGERVKNSWNLLKFRNISKIESWKTK
ncbi:MAG: hypothetical protein PHT29_01680 [Eubacteriales bacterium]|nr:hypothetical protein [Eubacteriales bacterium]MDD3863370.1 hypothetical protein [Eubacteriales bacterium]MDD4445362.1 hypothetical protein [Eubacteriales bacterium]